MSLTLLLGLAAGLIIIVANLFLRRRELHEMGTRTDQLTEAKERGSHAARLQYPQVDLAKCIGCGSCIAACPEEGVLELIHGQAIVVHGARCVGHGRCATECPTGGIVVRLGDIEERRDIPALTVKLESTETPDLFLAGELTGFALVRTAIEHGRGVAAEVARRKKETPTKAIDSVGELLGAGVGLETTHTEREYDLIIVGAGPAGLSCSLEAKNLGLSFITVDQDRLGGTVAHYPRQKMVLTQPVDLPLHGRLNKTSYLKEELIALWQTIADAEKLPIRTGLEFDSLARQDGETSAFTVKFKDGSSLRSRAVCLAMGRRGTPRKLGVPGEQSSKVSYGLVDAGGYEGRDILVVGGGDSAIEAALALAGSGGNRVTLSYRRNAFFRIKARNEARLEEALANKEITVLFESAVLRIGDDEVELRVKSGQAEVLPNDEVFVLAGGIPPFQQLEDAGVSFDPAKRPKVVSTEDLNGLFYALGGALAGTLIALLWAFLFRDYYTLASELRPAHNLHGWLAPAGKAGLTLGFCSLALVLVNLTYLLRKSPRVPLWIGTLQTWMTGHVGTGVLALVFALMHGAMAPRETVGGHALLALAVLVVTGGIGRYFYSFVPHAANGRDLDLSEVQARLSGLAAEWDREHRGFGTRIQAEVDRLVSSGHWRRTLPRRIVALLRARKDLRDARARLEKEARSEGLPDDQIRNLLAIASRAQRTALAAAHFEDLRGLLASWRYLHRWTALLMVLLVVAHVATAIIYGHVLER